MKEGIGERFQSETRYRRGYLPSGGFFGEMPETYKRYEKAVNVTLPPPRTKGGEGLWNVLRERRSLRSFQKEELKLTDLSQLLWAAQGITLSSMGFGLRTAPSAGALYPVETYIVVHSVSDLAPGVYHYAIENHELETLKKGDFKMQCAKAALDQEIAATANVVFIWTAIFARSFIKYGQRGIRYIYLDAGHISQNVALTAVAMGLGSTQIAALYDGEVNELLGIDGEKESAIYMTVVGRP